MYLFAGEQRDLATGLDYLRARWMDTGTGRFVSRDRFQAQLRSPITINRYAYANLSPTGWIDPTGDFSLAEGIASVSILSIVSAASFYVSFKVIEHFLPFFPLATLPSNDWTVGVPSFGSNRSNGQRAHAGVDLYAPVGTPIYAIKGGTVTQGPYHFYLGAYALEIDHGSFLARYGEIQMQTVVQAGDKVKGGQQIARVGQLNGYPQSMLHLELYDKTGSGPLTVSAL